MSSPTYSVVLAADSVLGIGKAGHIPWHIGEDLQFFKRLTRNHVVIMGRVTWQSLVPRYRPLPDRINIVVSSTLSQEACTSEHAPHDICTSIQEAVQSAAKNWPERRVFIIGGAHLIYSLLLDPGMQDSWSHIYLTQIMGDYGCDVKVPFLRQFISRAMHYLIRPEEVDRSGVTYRRVLHVNPDTVPEVGTYLNLLSNVLQHGFPRQDRTGEGTLSLFGQSVKYDLRGGVLPVFTCKRVPWKSVINELLWYLSGSTNVTDLHKVGIHYWDANSSRDFLDSRGLTDYPEGELGPVYGQQWRSWGGRGIDQVAEVVRLLREEPQSRRIILSAWNVEDLPKMALPPCHCFSQFLVDDQQQLHCILYQRSADLALGVPFNVTCYSALVHMLCHLVPPLRPGSLTHTMGDAHIYQNHVSAVTDMLDENPPQCWPRLRIVGDPPPASIDDFRLEHFDVVGYQPGPVVKLPMAV